jgi:hypothetical protein
MATWDNTTLSTVNSIAKVESEINALAGSFTRDTLKLTATTGIIVIAGGSMATTALTATYIDDSTETLAHNGSTGWAIVTGGYAVSICQSSTYVFPCVAGTGDVYDTNGLRFIDISLCTGVAWDASIIQSSWQNKITLCKSIIGAEIKTQLANQGYRDADVTSLNVLDYIGNPSVLYLPSDYLSLKLIYEDLFATQLTEAYKTKADYYDAQYRSELSKAMYLLTYGTGGTYYPIYNTQQVRQQV